MTKNVSMHELPRITDLSMLSPETLKLQNTAFLRAEVEYTTGKNLLPRELHHKIWVVRNGDLQRIIEDFPIDTPVNEQCAGWMHAIAGKHFFPDANHRTAMTSLRQLLKKNNIPVNVFPPTLTKETTIHSHRVRRTIEPVRLDTLYNTDRLFLVWLRYFNEILQKQAIETSE